MRLHVEVPELPSETTSAEKSVGELVEVEVPVENMSPYTRQLLATIACATDCVWELTFDERPSVSVSVLGDQRVWHAPFMPCTPHEWEELLKLYQKAREAVQEREEAWRLSVMERDAGA